MAMNSLPDYYAILGVPSSATTEDIRRAFRNAARRFHPDTNSHPGAERQFKDINDANATLGDVSARSNYDMSRVGNDSDRAFFSLRLTASKRILPRLSEQQVLFVLVELTPDAGMDVPRARQEAAPLNLVLVVDRSTSMKGARLERVKAAAAQLIEQLTPRDSLAIVAFSDRAEVLVKSAPVTDKQTTKSMLIPLQASGGTEMFQGLQTAFEQCLHSKNTNSVNHVIMITDGRTFGDEVQCLELAQRAAHEGIGFSAMGLGNDWNDTFLDQIAGATGGYVQYISSPSEVVSFLNDRVRTLGDSIAERVMLSIAPDADVQVEAAFRLSPNPQPFSTDTDPIPVGQMAVHTNLKVLLQLQIPALDDQIDFRSIIRVDATGDLIREKVTGHKVVADLSLGVETDPEAQETPLIILDALNKLKLFRLQQRAEDALAKGDTLTATLVLRNMATRYVEVGEEDLAHAARSEADRIESGIVGSGTISLTDAGHKRLKYGTRALLLQASNESSDRD